MAEYTTSVDPVGIFDGVAPVHDPYEMNDDDRILADHVKELFERSYNARLPYERQWELFRLYIRGEQLLYRDKNSGEIVRVVDFDNKRLFSVNNQSRIAARSLIGKLTRTVPSFTVVPASGDQTQVQGSRVADAFLRYFRRKEQLDVKIIRAISALPWAGTGCLKLEWDPEAGEAVALCPDPECGYFERSVDAQEVLGQECPLCRQKVELAKQEGEALLSTPGLPIMPEEEETVKQELAQAEATVSKLEVAKEGDAVVRHIDIRDIWVEPGCDESEDLRYIIYRPAVSVTEVRKKFPHMAHLIQAESGLYADKTARVTYSTATGNWGAEYLDEHVHLYEVHEAPTELYPKGRLIFMANDIILEERESPYHKFGRLPFFFTKWERNPGEFWPHIPMWDAWHRQKELNEVETAIRENTELLVRTKVLNPIGNRVASDEINATSAQVIAYNPAVGAPDYLRPPALGAPVYNRRDALINDIFGLFGITQNEAGIVPTDPNGRAMAILEAESDQSMGAITTLIHEELRQLHKCLLIMVQEMYAPDRKFTVAGDEALEVYSFQDINLQPGWDVDIETDDGMSRNQAIRITQAMDLANMGVLTDPMTGMPDVERFSKMARLKIPGIGPDTKSGEYSAAQALVKQIEDGAVLGQDVGPAPEDDPEIFREVFLHWLQTEGRKSNDQALVQNIRQLFQYYSQVLAEAQMAQMGGMAPGPEGGAGAGGPDMSAPGGSPNTPGHLGAAGPGAVGSDASAIVGHASQAAEGAASGATTPHES